MWQDVDGEEETHFEYTPCFGISDTFVATEQEANATSVDEVQVERVIVLLKLIVFIVMKHF
jgi:hypothetical protein